MIIAEDYHCCINRFLRDRSYDVDADEADLRQDEVTRTCQLVNMIDIDEMGSQKDKKENQRQEIDDLGLDARR